MQGWLLDLWEMFPKQPMTAAASFTPAPEFGRAAFPGPEQGRWLINTWRHLGAGADRVLTAAQKGW